jgi:glycosyltransferase involved in cell wall biosynthesis
MRVLLVTNGLLYGGAERIVEALAIGLSERDEQVAVVATTRDGPIGENLRARGISVTVLGIKSPLDVRVVPKLAWIAAGFRPDVVHSHLAVSDIVTAIAKPLLFGAKIVSTVHNSGVELDRLKLALWRRSLEHFDRVLAVGEVVRRSIDSKVKVEVLRPSLVEPSSPALSRGEARRQLGVGEDVPLAIGIGRLSHVKGFDVLAEAASLLETPGARVQVIGDGPDAEALRGTKLELLGAKNDAASLLAAADIVVCPSRSEGFPQVPLHAMALGVPLVATKVGGTPEIVVDGETGILVPPEDPQALARAIDALLGDRERREALGRRGRDRLEREGLTKRAMLDRTFEAYRSVLAKLT